MGNEPTSAPSSSHAPITAFKERHWDMLLDYIGEGRVVPVIGPELLVARSGSGTVPFYQAVAERLARHLEMEVVPGEGMDELMARFLKTNNPAKMARMGLSKVLREMAGEPQPALARLAGSRAFRLFLTTTPDSLLSTAIDNVCGGAEKADVYFFSRDFKGRRDIPSKSVPSGTHCVYHLYGRANPCVHYAISEDERLDYSCLWMDEANRPKNLLSFLSDKYLLILGCGYENWLARFFLFGLKGPAMFSNIWDANSLLADSRTPGDLQLDRFLSRCHGNIYYEGGAADFVDELCCRMGEAPALSGDDGESPFEENSIFLSYASEDREAALLAKQRLEAFGLPVWLDKSELKSGEAYDAKIARNIRNASFFLPLLSKTTAQTVEPRYFRREWTLATEEATKRSPKLPFIHPVAIDDVAPCDAFPESFNRLHWIAAPDGNMQDADVDRIIELAAQL